MAEERAWVRELRPGTSVEETFVVRSKETRQRRGGGSYLAMTLGDRTGQVTALAWENVGEVGSVCEVGRVVGIRGQVQRYNQRLQVIVRQAKAVEPESVDENLFVRSASVDPLILWQRLLALVEEVRDADLRQLLFRILSDPEVEAALKVAPAARGMHHAYRAGLLEHTVSMATLARPLAEHYRANAELVVTAVILHDLGKIWELETGPSIEYTDDGRLLGHLTLEVLHVDRVIAGLDDFPRETRRQLLHILLAHHGEYEYGSPRRPKTPEALLVHLIDTLDSKMAGMREAVDGDGETGEAWSAYSKILGRPVYRRRLPRPGDGDGDGEG